MKRALLLVLPLSTLVVLACDNAEPDELEPEAAAALAEDEADPDAVAAPEGERRGHRFKEKLAHMMAELDTDKDGALTREEAGDHFIARKFDKIDADADGKITSEELAAMKGRLGKRGGHGKGMKSPEERAKKKLARFDSDGDGAITAAELGDHHMAEKFAQIDADGDGRLVEAELVAWAREHGGKHRKGHRRHGAPDREPPVAG
jgi:Ca2+-binding EF-hand superfamily protein